MFTIGFKTGITLRNIIPDDAGKSSKKFYPANTKIQFTPLGVYMPEGAPCAGWVYKDIKKRVVHNTLTLKEGIDFKYD